MAGAEDQRPADWSRVAYEGERRSCVFPLSPSPHATFPAMALSRPTAPPARPPPLLNPTLGHPGRSPLTPRPAPRPSDPRARSAGAFRQNVIAFLDEHGVRDPAAICKGVTGWTVSLSHLARPPAHPAAPGAPGAVLLAPHFRRRRRRW